MKKQPDPTALANFVAQAADYFFTVNVALNSDGCI